MYWKGVSQENNRLMNRIFKIDKVAAKTFSTSLLFIVSGENCGVSAGDVVLAASVLVVECEVQDSSMLPGKLQHLLRRVRPEVRLEEAEKEVSE